ncbi:uncharacterized protein LOC105355528 isoform X1 [Oryzias latipes]
MELLSDKMEHFQRRIKKLRAHHEKCEKRHEKAQLEAATADLDRTENRTAAEGCVSTDGDGQVSNSGGRKKKGRTKKDAPKHRGGDDDDNDGDGDGKASNSGGRKKKKLISKKRDFHLIQELQEHNYHRRQCYKQAGSPMNPNAAGLLTGSFYSSESQTCQKQSSRSHGAKKRELQSNKRWPALMDLEGYQVKQTTAFTSRSLPN